MELYLNSTEKYVTDLFNNYCDKSFVFHNLEHTQTVVQRCVEIAMAEKMNTDAVQKLTVAALFHDTGYLFEKPATHERKSAEIMLNFYKERNVAQPILMEITEAILATKFPTHPQNRIQEILCDADTYHFGTTDFIESNEKVFMEFKIRNADLKKEDFNHSAVEMLRHHVFYTDYCRKNLEAGKQKNLEWLTGTSAL